MTLDYNLPYLVDEDSPYRETNTPFEHYREGCGCCSDRGHMTKEEAIEALEELIRNAQFRLEEIKAYVEKE